MKFSKTTTDLEAAERRAHSREQWGPFTVLVFRHDAIDQLLAAREPVRWMAAAYSPKGTRLYSNRGYHYRTKREAVAGLRKAMLARLDRIPTHIENLEREHAALMGALR